MPITPTSSTNGTPASGGVPPAPPALLGKDDFMKLLVAQLKNQDPSSPQDMTQMTAQMTQFGILEQLTNLAKASDATGTSLEQTHAVSLLGRTVTYLAADGSAVEGVVERVDTSGDSPSLTVSGKAGIDPKALVGVG